MHILHAILPDKQWMHILHAVLPDKQWMRILRAILPDKQWMHFLPDKHWVLILPDNSDGSSHRVASGLLPDGNAEADGECGVVEVNDQLRQMQANPVELGPPGVCV